MRSLVLGGSRWAMRDQAGESRQSIPVERTSKYSLQSDFAGTRALAEDMHFCVEVIRARE
jgi:hypothetical protein